MTVSCIHSGGRARAAVVASLVTAGFTCALASAQAKQRPADQPALQAQVNEIFGLRESTIVTLALPNAPGRPLAVGIQINGQGYTLDLQPHSVRADDFVCYEVLPDHTLVEVDPGPERTLRGTVRDDGGSIVAASLLEDGLYAMMLFANGERYWIEPLAGRVAGAAPGSHVVYQGDDVLEQDVVCGNPDDPDNFAEEVFDDDGEEAFGDGPDCITQLAAEADFPYFQRYGTIQNVAVRIGSVLNTMNIQYEIEVDITHVITALVVRTTAASDPYTTTDSFDLVCQLGNYWDANLSIVGRDTVQLFTGREIDGGTIGRAADFGQICNPDSCGIFPCDGCGPAGIASGHYSFVQSDYNNIFGCATDLSAHELGHLWDAHHCNCPDCTMNPFLMCNNTFCGPGVQAAIIAFRNSVTCLDCADDDSFCGDRQAGICYTANTSPYCDDADCCETVCAVDPFCCGINWDQLCADQALDLCGNCGDPEAGSCLENNGTPGCDNADCCAIVCMFDDFCCDNFWDAICAQEAAEFCALPPENDLCEDAFLLKVPDFAVGFTNNATFDGFPFCGTSNTAPGVWYMVVGTGNTMTATTCSEFTEYNTKLSVYCNSCGDPTCVAGNDDDCDMFGGLHSTVTWCSQEGAEYLILVHGSGNATGGFNLSISDDGVVCAGPVDCLPPDPCPWDLDDSGTVGLSDLLELLEFWGDPYGLAELLDLLAAWGPCP